MSFKDVTVSFTRDEWLQLTGTQRTLYQDVMLENYSHLVFVEAPVSQQLLRSLTSYLPWRVLRHQTRGDLQVGARRALATRGRIPRSSWSRRVNHYRGKTEARGNWVPGVLVLRLGPVSCVSGFLFTVLSPLEVTKQQASMPQITFHLSLWNTNAFLFCC